VDQPELHGGNAVLARERLDRRQEAIVSRPEEDRRRNGIPEMIVEK